MFGRCRRLGVVGSVRPSGQPLVCRVRCAVLPVSILGLDVMNTHQRRLRVDDESGCFMPGCVWEPVFFQQPSTFGGIRRCRRLVSESDTERLLSYRGSGVTWFSLGGAIAYPRMRQYSCGARRPVGRIRTELIDRMGPNWSSRSFHVTVGTGAGSQEVAVYYCVPRRELNTASPGVRVTVGPLALVKRVWYWCVALRSWLADLFR